MLFISKKTAAAGGGPTPADLFGAGEEGVFYNISDLSTLWRDTGGTVQVTADGQSVARVDDLSGNGNHLTQATASMRPVYKTSGGLHWLEFDGVDDYQATGAFGVAFSEPWERISGIRQVAWQNDDRIFEDSQGDFVGFMYMNGTSPRILMYAGTFVSGMRNSDAAVGSDVVVSEYWDTASSSLTVDNGTPTTGNPGDAPVQGLMIARRQASGNLANIRVHGLAQIDRALTSQERSDTRDYFAGLQGRTL